MGALTRLMVDALKLSEEKGISVNEAVNIIMNKQYGNTGDMDAKVEEET